MQKLIGKTSVKLVENMKKPRRIRNLGASDKSFWIHWSVNTLKLEISQDSVERILWYTQEVERFCIPQGSVYHKIL